MGAAGAPPPPGLCRTYNSRIIPHGPLLNLLQVGGTMRWHSAISRGPAISVLMQVQKNGRQVAETE